MSIKLHAAYSLALILAGGLMTSTLGYSREPDSSTLIVSPDGTSATLTLDEREPPGFSSSRVIVRFRSGQSVLSGSPRSVLLSKEINLHRVDNPPGLTVDKVIEHYKQHPNVVYVEPDYAVQAIRIPNDPAYPSQQWNMPRIAAPLAWDLHTDSSNMVVAVVDTGIDYSHPDLMANLYSDAINPFIHGYTCRDGACLPGGADDYGHGSHVAGVIGAASNNGIGVAGINWQVKLLSIKFLDATGGGYISDAVAGFDLLRNLKQSGVNIRVTNNSWGGGGFSLALKDAMTLLEQESPGQPGTLDVCAAGNSGVNADATPMYPAAYNNRGILSVLATDSNDAGASFSNYGLASVDLAAPGVGIYSTVPAAGCALCDPTAYLSLSGTSMAAPHVAGVAAALLDMNPALTSFQARDALLHPASYDTVVDAKASATSTAGRLNVVKTLTNTPYLSNPVLNQFPTLTMGPDKFVSGGETVDFSPVIADPDNDPTRTASSRGPVGPNAAWLFGWQANQIFPNGLPFSAPDVARTAAMPYDIAVADNRGGGVTGRNWAVVSQAADHGSAPAGTLIVPQTGSVGVPVPVSFAAVDPEGSAVRWDLWASGNSTSSGLCCLTGSTSSLTFSLPGVYRVAAQAIDQELNLSENYTAVISIDGAAGMPPLALAQLDKDSGMVPLTVNVDMSASYDPDGAISSYLVSCGDGTTKSTLLPTHTCSYTAPGTYWLLLQVRDKTGLTGLMSRYVVAYPSGPVPPVEDTTTPTVSITHPLPGENVSGVVSLDAIASDNAGGSGVREVEYYLDAVKTEASLGKATTPTYLVNWDSSKTASGPHTIHAIARDNAGNQSPVASVAITLNLVKPIVALAPSGSIVIAKKSTLNMSATISNLPTYAIERVEFLVDAKMVCSDRTAPYACAWKSPAAKKSYLAQARAYDNQGNVGLSGLLTIYAQ